MVNSSDANQHVRHDGLLPCCDRRQRGREGLQILSGFAASVVDEKTHALRSDDRGLQDEWRAYRTEYGGTGGMRSMPGVAEDRASAAVAPATETCTLPCAYSGHLRSYWFLSASKPRERADHPGGRSAALRAGDRRLLRILTARSTHWGSAGLSGAQRGPRRSSPGDDWLHKCRTALQRTHNTRPRTASLTTASPPLLCASAALPTAISYYRLRPRRSCRQCR